MDFSKDKKINVVQESKKDKLDQIIYQNASDFSELSQFSTSFESSGRNFIDIIVLYNKF